MRDLCPEIALVVDAFRAEGQVEIAARVVDVVEAGATGGEILMGVRHVLSQFLHAGVVPELWTRVSEVVVHIDRVLDPEASKLREGAMSALVAALGEHLRSHAPWGARVEIGGGQSGAPSRVGLADERAGAARAAFREAFGTDVVEMGCGGSIPIVAEFVERNPGALVLVTAVTDPTSRMHGIDESMDLGDFAKAALAEALLLDRLGG